MKYFKLIWMLCLLFSFTRTEAQETIRSIEISYGNSIITVPEYDEFKFKNQYGILFSGKIKIYNDSQFGIYNFFNELGPDTFHIADISYVKIKTKKKKYIIRPPLVVFGLIFTPLLTVPVVVFKLINNKKQAYEWVGPGSFSVKFVKYTKEEDNTSE